MASWAAPTRAASMSWSVAGAEYERTEKGEEERIGVGVGVGVGTSEVLLMSWQRSFSG